MKLRKIATGGIALALALALTPAIASAANSSASDNAQFGFWLNGDREKPVYFSSTMTVSASRDSKSGKSVDLDAVHYGDTVKVNFSAVKNPEGYSQAPKSANITSGIWTEEMDFSKYEGNSDDLRVDIPGKADEAFNPQSGTSYEFQVPCSLEQQTYYVSGDLRVELADMGNLQIMQVLSNDPERLFANVPFTINDPEGADRCAGKPVATTKEVKKPTPKPTPTAEKGILSRTGAIALGVAAVAVILIAVGGTITWRARRKKTGELTEES